MSLLLIPDGPGTTIELRDGVQGLPVAPRGTGAIMGQFASGPTTFAALAMTPAHARLISGTADDDFEASLALSDVYSFASPLTLIGRVTDGLDVAAAQSIWDRNPYQSRLHRTAGTDRAPLATLSAHNGGRWGGRRRCFVGSGTITSLITSSSTFATGTTMLVDVLAGAIFYIESDDSGKSYTVESNTTAGVITIEGEFSATAMDLTGTKRYQVVLSGGKELSVVIGQDNEVGVSFSLKAERKFDADGQWETVTSYSNLGLSTTDDKPWVATITDGEENEARYQIAVTTSYTGATVENKLPANFCEIPTTVSGATMTVAWWRWSAGSANTGNPYLDDIDAINTDFIEPHVYDLTFTAATTATVTATFPNGTAISLGTLTLGTLFNPVHPQLSTIMVRAGAVAAIATDTLKIRVNPLPLDLAQRNAYLYPAGLSEDGNSSIRLKIVSSTYNTVSVRSDLDLADYDALAPASPSVTGTADLSAVTIIAGQTVILTPDGMTAVTLTVGVGGIGPGAAAIAAGLQALDTANIFAFTAVGNNLKIALAQSVGASATLLVGNGTADATIGITNGNSYSGTDGNPARIEGRWPMWGGYDGATPAAARYAIALDSTNHVFRRHMSRNLGLVRLATPGVTTTSVKENANTLVSENGWMYIAEFATSLYTSVTPGEAAVANMTTNESESDYVEHYFPSHAKFRNVSGTRLVERSISGVVIGLRARLASVGVDGEKGMHIAAANNNTQGKISPRVKGLPDDIGRWTPPIELLDNNGIVAVRWEGPDVFLYGNRMYSAGRTQASKRYTIAERAVYYHVARDLFVTTRPFIFKSISAKRLSQVQLALRDKLKAYWQDGWFSDVNGTAFEDQVTVAVPLDLNPPANLLEGLVTATVQFRPRPALEDLHIIISPTELTAE